MPPPTVLKGGQSSSIASKTGRRNDAAPLSGYDLSESPRQFFNRTLVRERILFDPANAGGPPCSPHTLGEHIVVPAGAQFRAVAAQINPFSHWAEGGVGLEHLNRRCFPCRRVRFREVARMRRRPKWGRSVAIRRCGMSGFGIIRCTAYRQTWVETGNST
jgi:hypothetical protein